MKFKFLLSLLLAASAGTAMADTQEGPLKWTDNIYVNFGVGGMTVINDGINSPTLNAHIQLGKLITPTWGVRAEVGGLWQSLETQNTGYYKYCKKFGELNLDATLNLNSLFGNKNIDRAVNVYIFGGPTLNLSSAVRGQVTTTWTGYAQTFVGNNYILTPVNPIITSSFESEGTRLRVGATVGLGLGFHLSNKWALNVEGRYGVTPSIFGQGSDCRKAESTARATVGLTYVFGGLKTHKCPQPAVYQPAPEPTIKYVTKEVPKEVIKEVTKEVPSEAAIAILFKINKWDITEESKVNIKLMADIMKKYPNRKYTVAGYADKATGSAKRNQFLSDKRAEVVYDALVKEGVNPSQLVKVGNGGVENMFFDKPAFSRVVILNTSK